jgi:uncharacterized protein
MARSFGLLGIDIAYVIALCGTLFSASFFVNGGRLFMLNHEQYFLFFDFFPALFFFLNGLTVTLTMRDKRISSRRLLYYLGKRGLVLLLIGFLFIGIWPLNVLFASGVFYILAPLFANWNNVILRTLSLAVALCAILMVNLDVDTNVSFSGLDLSGLKFSNLFSFVFFNSYYSILPWICFFLFGMLFGRNDLRLKGILPPSSILAFGTILLAFFVQKYSHAFYTEGDKTEYLHIFPFNVKLYMPAFLIFGLGAITLIMNFLIYVFRRDLDRSVVKRIQNLSGAKYSVVFFHLLISVILMSITNEIAFRNKWIIFLLASGTVFVSIFITLTWKSKISDTTPIEWLIKRLSNSTKK